MLVLKEPVVFGGLACPPKDSVPLDGLLAVGNLPKACFSGADPGSSSIFVSARKLPMTT